jgi:sugar lactone lactonase YvrE
MKSNQTETKSKSTLGLTRHLLNRVMCLGAVILTCSSAPAQNLFVSDGYSNSGNIYKFTPDGVQSTFASGLHYTFGLAFDSAGNLFVTVFSVDSNGVVNSSIYKFTPDGVRSTFASGLHYTFGLAFDSAGNLFVTDFVGGLGGSINGTIYKFTPDGMRTTFALGLSFPRALAFDRAGNLFVVDRFDSILKFTPNGVRTTFASGSELNTTTGLACDSAGNLFVSEYGSGVKGGTVNGVPIIYKFAPSGVRTTFASPSELNGPTALAFDSTGNLFVSDDTVTDSSEEHTFPGAIYKFTPDGQRSTFTANLHGFPSIAFQPTQTPTSTPTPTPAPTPTPSPTPRPSTTPTPSPTPTPTPTPPTTGPAVMLIPPPGATFTSSSVTFSWSAGSATAYFLLVGSSPNGADIYNSGIVTVHSKTVNNIPTDGRTIYATLLSEVNNSWTFKSYTYKAF